jgi:hypothetical protein
LVNHLSHLQMEKDPTLQWHAFHNTKWQQGS